ncbi:RNA-binding protein [Rhodococcus sp. 15-649-2-2]|uniref:TROVE domain-containing protein n=1 Tax=Rhodococcus sp. 15-649-2-2 TaxID=2023140 RepID=UPI000B9B85E2|nr:TROVE domain-containing protein [Rhodococcus sp. 15-649-2-2]OZE77201.1 RNA-binding protein [Rhodococcus sp. 15-649-2-2]
MDILTTVNTKRTSQAEQADSRQAQNAAGGFTFTVTPETRLRRFLTLGTDGGTFYTSAADLTKDNAQVVLDFAANNTATLVREVVSISQAGRAPKQNPALFALAAAASLGDDDGRKLALAALPDVARTGTHLFLFAQYVEQFRGWGRGLRRAVGNWYLDKPTDAVAYQAVKYRQREGWSHRDLLRLAHPITDDAARKALFDYIVRGSTDGVPRIVEGFEKAQAKPHKAAKYVTKYGLSWEMLPDSALNDHEVWEALLDNGVPQTALIRQLPRLTRMGLLDPMGSRTALVAAQLADPERLRKARVHPINVLVAQRTYASGHSARGGAEWTPSPAIVDALDAAFYAAFGAVEPSNKRHLLALDVSGSMMSPISGLPLSAREASAALALVTTATEPAHMIVGFTSSRTGFRSGTGLTQLNISPRRRLDDAIRAVSNLPFGGTDCSLPIMAALQQNIKVDVFSVYTDNETWAGPIHPHQALQQYRREVNPNAKLVVVGMTATEFSIADSNDSGMLDVAGFDSATPSLLSGFARGDI